MSELFKADNINLYNEWAGVETQNPLVGFIDFSAVKPLRHTRKFYGFYASPALGFLLPTKNLRHFLIGFRIGDLVKKETGKSAIEHIQRKMLDTAKDYLMQTDKSISEIAYLLGYQYPQYFSRAFKKATGQTPKEYRMAD